MYIPFEEMSSSSRIWIYQSDRKFNEEEVQDISNHLQSFTEGWAAHNLSLKTSFCIKYNHFIILSVDESDTGASGCSIDSSVKTIKEIETKHNLSFFDRLNLAFIINEKVKITPLNCLEKEIKLENINKQSIFFNNLASTIGNLSSNWMIPIEKTWLNKFFNTK